MSPRTSRHILVLVDRDWSHPQAGGTGENLRQQVRYWLEWGHRVTVLASAFPGARSIKRDDGLTVRRMGGRATVFPRAIAELLRDPPRVDMVLEIVNGIAFLTPLWLRAPVVVQIHHVHRRLYAEELGAAGRPLGFVLETLPLRRLYGRRPFMTVSNASADELVALGIERDRIAINRNGVALDELSSARRAATPTLVYLGRLKAYKRVELLLDILPAVPGVSLDIVGEGGHRLLIEDEIRRRGLTGRVRLHGFVDEPTKRRLLQRAWINVTASSAEGWCLSVSEAAACATPTVALAVGGLRESVVDGTTGLLADDLDGLIRHVRRLAADPALCQELGYAARARVSTLRWADTAKRTFEALEVERRRWRAAQMLAGARVPARAWRGRPGTQSVIAGSFRNRGL
ncbi:MAG: glycosyltransferase family 4 protein [Solirubrobacteraceae bacterium]